MNGLYDEFRIAVHSVWQRRWLALAIAWVICLLGWLAVAMIPNSYESTARILVQQKTILPNENRLDAQERTREIEQVQQSLTSAVNLEKVIRSTDLGQNISDPRQMQVKVSSLRGNISVVAQDEGFFEISARSSDSSMSDGENAKISRDIVQKLIDIFVEENLAGGRGETRKTLKFLDDQLSTRQIELEEAEAKRVAFETENLGLLPGAGSIGQRLSRAGDELRSVNAELSSARASLNAMNAQLGRTSPTISTPGFSSGDGGGARAQLSQAEQRLSILRARGLTDQHPDVISAQREIADLRGRAAREPSGSNIITQPNPAYSSLQSLQADRQANVSALEQQKAVLEADIASLRDKQSTEPGLAAEQSQLNRDYEVLKNQYDELLEQREALRLRGQVQTETDALRFSVTDPPSAPTSPVDPNRPLLLLMVLAAGIGGGVAAAFALAQIKASYATADRLAKAAGLPVIGSISHTLTSAQRAIRKRRMRWFYGATAGLLVLFGVLQALEVVVRGSVV